MLLAAKKTGVALAGWQLLVPFYAISMQPPPLPAQCGQAKPFAFLNKSPCKSLEKKRRGKKKRAKKNFFGRKIAEENLDS